MKYVKKGNMPIEGTIFNGRFPYPDGVERLVGTTRTPHGDLVVEYVLHSEEGDVPIIIGDVVRVWNDGSLHLLEGSIFVRDEYKELK